MTGDEWRTTGWSMSRSAVTASPDYLALFGRNVRAKREQAGLKQVEVGERIGVGQQRLALIESGKQNVTLKTMASLAEALGCDLPGMLVEPGRRSEA
jgi:transcriptional regulator with XRE-family HTH domain